MPSFWGGGERMGRLGICRAQAGSLQGNKSQGTGCQGSSSCSPSTELGYPQITAAQRPQILGDCSAFGLGLREPPAPTLAPSLMLLHPCEAIPAVGHRSESGTELPACRAVPGRATFGTIPLGSAWGLAAAPARPAQAQHLPDLQDQTRHQLPPKCNPSLLPAAPYIPPTGCNWAQFSAVQHQPGINPFHAT